MKLDMNSKVTYRSGGCARILCVDGGDEDFPVVSINELGACTRHTPDGRWGRFADQSPKDLVLISKYGDFKDGDEVLCYYVNALHIEQRRYFAYEKNGLAYCYAEGTTQWSSGNKCTEAWDVCVKYQAYGVGGYSAGGGGLGDCDASSGWRNRFSLKTIWVMVVAPPNGSQLSDSRYGV